MVSVDLRNLRWSRRSPWVSVVSSSLRSLRQSPVVSGGPRLFSMVSVGLRSLQWSPVVCGGLRWSPEVSGGFR